MGGHEQVWATQPWQGLPVCAVTDNEPGTAARGDFEWGSCAGCSASSCSGRLR